MVRPLDRLGRALEDLRISVTDRCNFRCPYCMPRAAFGDGHRFLSNPELLTIHEIARVARVFAGLGVRKLRLTGGEPLLRADLPDLVELLATIPDCDLALTTNGALLERRAAELARAGLRRVTVSLDSLDAHVFRTMSDSDVPVTDVLRGIDAALAAGLAPVKLNAVVRRGVNDATVVELARRFRGTGVVVRFIEYMDVGTTNHWSERDVVSGKEIVDRIDATLPLEPVEPSYAGEVARRYRYRDGGGEIGIVASVTQPFCGACTRARLSADGRLYTCLFATRGVDLRHLLRDSGDDGVVERAIHQAWREREDRYSELRTELATAPKIEMSYIGG